MRKSLYFFILASQTLTASVSRNDIPEEDRWNLSAMYATCDSWQHELDSLLPSKTPPLFPQLITYKDSLGSSAENLPHTLNAYHDTLRKIEKLYVYANLSHYEDIANPQNKTRADQITEVLTSFSQETSWIQPELFSLPDKKFQEYLNNPKLAEYKKYLEKLLHQKPHVRSADEEQVIAQAMSVLESPAKAFSAFNNADIQFGTVHDSEGKAHTITHATAASALRSTDRTLRKNTFYTFTNKYLEHENSITELFAGTVKSHHFVAKTRRYNSCLEAALKPNNIDVQVYHSLIEATRARVDLLHRYVKLKKQHLNLDELHQYDMAVPLASYDTKNYTYAEAQALTIEAVQPLGPEYSAILKNGLANERWVDRYENKNKRSGAYSSGCFDSMPYISMNFTGTLRDVFTLAHEAGHSMHTYHSTRHQPYHTAGYSIFVAEVASTFNEELLRQMLLSQAKSTQDKVVLLNQPLDDIQATLYRQVMFAEFELFAHSACEQNTPLTPKLLKDKYLELCSFYYGPELTLDPECSIYWAVVPHFHANFYVYQYATGISAALALADNVLKGDDAALDRYLTFLRAGSSKYPLDVLADAGCDLRTPAPVDKALDQFESYLNELEQLLTTEQDTTYEKMDTLS